MTRGKFLGFKGYLLPLARFFAKKTHKTITSCLSRASLEKIGSRSRHANFFSDRHGPQSRCRNTKFDSWAQILSRKCAQVPFGRPILLLVRTDRRLVCRDLTSRLQYTPLTMPDPVVTYRGTIYPWHCDHMGHMNVMWYVGKFDEATWHLLASAGLTAKRMRAEGIGMVAVEQRIEYKRELLAGDLITIRSWFQEIRDKAVLFVHEMANEETQEIAARTLLTGVCLDTKTRKATPLPADVRERILIVLNEGTRDQRSGALRKQEAPGG